MAAAVPGETMLELGLPGSLGSRPPALAENEQALLAKRPSGSESRPLGRQGYSIAGGIIRAGI